MKPRVRFVALAVGLAILAGVGLSESHAQTGPTLSLQLDEPEVQVGDLFTVSVHVADPGATTAWQAGLAYDPNVIVATEAFTIGNFATLTNTHTLHQFEGDRAVFALYQLCNEGRCNTTNEGGELIEVEFEALTIGTSPLSFVESVLVAPDGGEQDITLGHGSVRVDSALPMDNFVYLPVLQCSN